MIRWILCWIVAVMMGTAGVAAAEKTLSVAVSFGPSVSVPDPAKGSNGWYLTEAGVTETLFALDTDMALVPCVGESIRNIDSLTWEIRLKEGLLFHDDTPVDAQAVKWAIDRLVDEKSEVFNKAVETLLDIRAVTVVGDLTLQIETNCPNAALPYDLTSPAVAVISPSGKRKEDLRHRPLRS